MTMFRELFEPMTVGPMQVVNRIMMSAMSAGMMLDKDGQITPEMIAYFIERVRNNPGMAAVGPVLWSRPPNNGNILCRSTATMLSRR